MLMKTHTNAKFDTIVNSASSPFTNDYSAFVFAQLLLSSYLHVLVISTCLINIWRYIYTQNVFLSSGSAEKYVFSNFILKIEIPEGHFTFLPRGKQRQHPFSFFSNNGPGIHVFYSDNPCRCDYDLRLSTTLDSLFF